MTVIVTGSSGKLGLPLCRRLSESGLDVIGTDWSPAPAPVTWREFTGDLRDPWTIHRAMDLADEVTAVIHLAGHTNVHSASPEVVLRENLAINSGVFAAAIQRRASRVVFASSVQAMLGGTDSPFAEQMKPDRFPISELNACRPTNAYGLSKCLGEQMLAHMISEAFSGGTTSAISLRFPFLLGEKGFRWSSERPREARYEWGGAEAFAYVALVDVVRAAHLAVSVSTDRIARHQVLWLSAPDPRVAESIAELAERFYSDVPGIERAVAAGSFMDCSLSERVLGWKPERLLCDFRQAPDAPLEPSQ